MSAVFKISTKVTRTEHVEVDDFTISCNRLDAESYEEEEPAVASLSGMVHHHFGMPGISSLDIYDERSGHSYEALMVMKNRRSMIKRRLPLLDFDSIATIVLLERAWVSPSMRGHGLSLRMMREAMHLFARFDAFAILKAHPDGDEVSYDDCRRLARYYASDDYLKLTPISQRACPGWMVASWEDEATTFGDSAFWTSDR